MSVIKTDLLQNRLGTSHPAVTKADFVKKWGVVDIQVNPPAFRVAYGCSSVTDISLGVCEPVYTSPMATANYAVNANVGSPASGLGAGYPIAATHCRLISVNSTFAPAENSGYFSFSVKGDLA